MQTLTSKFCRGISHRVLIVTNTYLHRVTASAALTAAMSFICVSITNKECQLSKTSIQNKAENQEHETALYKHIQRQIQILLSIILQQFRWKYDRMVLKNSAQLQDDKTFPSLFNFAK